MEYDSLYTFFDNYLPLNDEERSELAARCTIRKIKRRHFLLQQGDVCWHYHFIVGGCVKMYFIDDKGTEHNLQFAAEDQWITDLASFHPEKPSKLYIEALEPTTEIRLQKSDLIYFYENHPKFDRTFRVILERQFVKLQDRLLMNISSSAIDRYEHFLEVYPHLANRLPNTQIASYLGITPEFLSRIRKERATQ